MLSAQKLHKKRTFFELGYILNNKKNSLGNGKVAFFWYVNFFKSKS